MKKAEYLKTIVKESNIKITQILDDHWLEFKKTKIHKVPADMRKSVVEAGFAMDAARYMLKIG